MKTLTFHKKLEMHYLSCITQEVLSDCVTRQPAVSPNKGPVMQKAFPYHEVTTLIVEMYG